jgi:hypothetical protein
MRDYIVRDLHGYSLSFGHRLSLADGPPLPIERVDVPVRLEKRLAALLHDLAAHERMTVNSCLEEILLHTNDPLGDGVVSPHTRRTLHCIQELKRKHRTATRATVSSSAESGYCRRRAWRMAANERLRSSSSVRPL